MSRKENRESLFQLVFEFCFSGKVNETSLQNVLDKIDNETEKKYVCDVYYGVAEKYKELSFEIEEKSKGYIASRLFKVDLAILLVALYEIRFYNIPKAVSINEAVELAKKYSTEKSPNFVNGVLAGLVN